MNKNQFLRSTDALKYPGVLKQAAYLRFDSSITEAHVGSYLKCAIFVIRRILP